MVTCPDEGEQLTRLRSVFPFRTTDFRGVTLVPKRVDWEFVYRTLPVLDSTLGLFVLVDLPYETQVTRKDGSDRSLPSGVGTLPRERDTYRVR